MKGSSGIRAISPRWGFLIDFDLFQGRCPWLSHFAPLGLKTVAIAFHNSTKGPAAHSRQITSYSTLNLVLEVVVFATVS